MTYFEQLKSIWAESMQQNTKASVWLSRLYAGDLDVRHYMGFLLETYHNTAYNPQLQAFATMYLKNNPREVVKRFLMHATSEVGHDLLALNDLLNLGANDQLIKSSRPLATTKALQYYAVYSIQFVSPLCYLGYLFHLEFSPVNNGEKVINLLKSKGVPERALSFLMEHSTVDIGHLKFMESYVSELVQTTAQFEFVTTSLIDCIELHTKMIENSFANGERVFADKIISNAS